MVFTSARIIILYCKHVGVDGDAEPKPDTADPSTAPEYPRSRHSEPSRKDSRHSRGEPA